MTRLIQIKKGNLRRVALVDEPMSTPTPRASIKARARPPIKSHLDHWRPRRRGAGSLSDRVQTVSSKSSISIPPFLRESKWVRRTARRTPSIDWYDVNTIGIEWDFSHLILRISCSPLRLLSSCGDAGPPVQFSAGPALC